jgi:hypothetical protein
MPAIGRQVASMADDRVRVSGVYALTVTGIILLAALICSVYIPRGAFIRGEFLQELRINESIITLVFCMTVVAVTVLGLESLIYDFELTTDKVIEGEHAILEKLDAWEKGL